MSQLLAYIGSDPALVRYALLQVQGVIPEVPEAGGWGVGYEQESRMLLRQHPASRSLSMAPVLSDLRTRAFIGHAARPGAARTPADAQPSRWRHWLMAVAGLVTPLGSLRRTTLDELPDFLARNLQGEGDGEVLFHRFLTHLKGEQGDLQRIVLDTAPMIEALRRTVAELEAVAAVEELPAPRLAITATDGRSLLALTLGTPLGLKHVEGVPPEVIPEGDPLRPTSGAGRLLLPDFRACMAYSDERGVEGWEPLAPRTLRAVGPRWGVRDVAI